MARLTLLLWICLAAGLAGANEGKLEQARLEELREQIESVQETLRKHSKNRDALSAELERRERAMAQITAAINQLDREIADLDGELDELNTRRVQLETERDAQQRHIAREVDAAFRLGQSEPLKLLLNQEDPEQLNRMLKYYGYFLEARGDKIASYRATMTELDAVRAGIDSRQQRLSERRQSQQQEQRALDREQQERRGLLAKINAELDTDQARLTRLEQEREQLELLISSLEEAIQDLAPPSADPFPRLRGKLPWPIEGRVLQAFGSPRARNLPWKGWLIATSEGEPINAVHQGRVVFADYLRGHGLVVIIDHGSQYLSLYAHNQVLLKETGEWVGSGETIALAGKSGGLSDSALYFEIRHNGQPQDPKSWLGRRG